MSDYGVFWMLFQDVLRTSDQDFLWTSVWNVPAMANTIFSGRPGDVGRERLRDILEINIFRRGYL